MFEALKTFKIKKLKKSLFCFGSAKKASGALVLFTMIFGMTAPMCALAGYVGEDGNIPISELETKIDIFEPIKEKLLGPAKDIFSGMIGVSGALLVGLTSIPLSLSQAALGWVTSDDFINVSFTGGKKGDANYNMVVDEGWKIMRNLVNMFIVLGFVIVGIATILGIQEYNAQKLLPLLIAIALLINFTPVICGLVIDASNITMNHFLSGATLDRGFVETASYQAKAVMGAEGLEAIEKAGLAFVFAGFNIIGAVVFGLFALLFAVRYLAIWILVILSPLAFFCYIFPKARGVWSAWWTQFFQWCIIGIPAAFFIYLSNILIAQMSKGGVVSNPTGEISTTGFGSLFMYMIPLAFMVIGLFASFKTGAMGATMITSFAQTTGKKHAQWAGGKALGLGKLAVRGGTGWALSTKSGEKVRQWSERQAASRTPGAGEKGAKAKIKQGALFLPYAMRRQVGRAITPIPGAQKAVAKEAFEKAKKQDAATNTSDFHSTIDPDKRAGIISAMVEEKQMKYALDKDKLRGKEVTKGEMLTVYQRAIDMKDDKTRENIERSYIKDGWKEMGQIAMRKGVITQKDMAEKGHKDYRDVIIDGTKSADNVKQLQKGFQKDEKIMESINKFWGGQQVGEAAKTFGREFADTQQAFAEDHKAEWYLEPKNFNTKIPNYMNSSTAQGIGFSSITGGDRLEKTKIGEASNFAAIRKEKKTNIDKEIAKAPLSNLEKRKAQREIQEEIGEKIAKITPEIKEIKGKIKKEKNQDNIGTLKEELKNKRQELKTKKIEMREGTLQGKAGKAGEKIKSKMKKDDEKRYP
jgi:hypothetical protein